MNFGEVFLAVSLALALRDGCLWLGQKTGERFKRRLNWDKDDPTGCRPQPDWGRKGTQPGGALGDPPPPNGQLVATKPESYGTFRGQPLPPPGPENIIVRTPNPFPAPKSVKDQ